MWKFNYPYVNALYYITSSSNFFVEGLRDVAKQINTNSIALLYHLAQKPVNVRVNSFDWICSRQFRDVN